MATMTLNLQANQFLPLDPTASDWKDVTPVYQQDGTSPLCPILYDTKYSSAMDLLRAFLSSPNPERSARALALTEHLIRLNPSNYSVWHYRAYILLGPEPLESISNLHQLSKDILSGRNEEMRNNLKEELDFIDVLANENMKSYQVWQHRRLVVTALSDPSKELQFVRNGLLNDSKNYHTWVYRQWVLSHFAGFPKLQNDPSEENAEDLNQCPKLFRELWDGELDYVEELLVQDIRNNSAWNHRYFVLFSSGRFKTGKAVGCEGGEEATILREIEYTKSKLQIAPHNASSWNYLRGLLSLINSSPTTFPPRTKIYQDLLSFSLALIPTSEEAKSNPSVDSNGRTSIGALEFCFDEVESRIKNREALKEEKETRDFKEEIDFWIQRLSIADPIRKRYWNYRRKELEELI